MKKIIMTSVALLTISLSGASDSFAEAKKSVVSGENRIQSEKSLVKNGTFEEGTDKKGNPKFWGFNKSKGGQAEVITTDEKNHAVRLTPGARVSQIFYGTCFLPSVPKKVIVTFKAKGKGQLWVTNARFEQILNEKGKRVNHYLGAQQAGKFALTDKETIYTVEYTIPAKEFSQLIFQAVGKNAECVIDDVSAREIE